MEATVITGATLIDGLGGNPMADSVVVIKDGKIMAAGKSGQVQVPQGPDATQIDAKGKTVMPGLIDGHIHLYMDAESDDFFAIPIHNNSIDMAMRSVPRMKRTLAMGFTTVRDGGSGYNWFEVSVRNAVERGDIVGPRLLTSGYHLTVTGGHGYFLPAWIGRLVPDEQVGMHCDGADGWRKAARKNLYYGTDNVKMVSSRGIASLGLRGATEPDHEMATLEELSAAVDEAHRRGKKAIAHAMGAKPIQNAIKAGIDTIVHGFYMDEETAQMMVDHNVALEPTTMYPKLAAEFGEGKLQPRMVEKAKIIAQDMKEQFAMLLDKGVTISFGTDGGGVPFFPHGTNARELVDLVELGMTPMAAIQSATLVAAQTIGLGDELGTIEAGKTADVIIVDADPLSDISVLTHKENIQAVMRSGEMLVGRGPYAALGLLL